VSTSSSLGEVTYLITSYGKVAQLERLVRTLRRLTRGRIWLRHDFSKTALPQERFEPIGDVTVLPTTTPVTWGDFSFVEAILMSLEVVENDGSYDWLVMLSGQDYPIRPLHELERYLCELDADALLEQTVDAHDSARYRRKRFDRGADLYRYRYFGIPEVMGRPVVPRRAIRRLESLGAVQPLISVREVRRTERSVVGLRWPLRPFRGLGPPYQGSNWMVLRRRAVQAALSFVGANPSYVRHYRRTFVPSESFFHTIVRNDPDLHVSTGYLHFEEWPLHASGPATLTVDALPTLRESSKYFARKFDAEVDSVVLDELDRHLGLPQ